tara:strand:+ start:441 stop:1091 length:651 start_codon:yes stop_codon:yes gene_type:complete
MNLVLFDLDDTLLSGDTEGEWVKYMLNSGMIQDDSFLERMSIFTQNYRNGILNIFDYSNFLLGPLHGIEETSMRDRFKEFSKEVVGRLSDATTDHLLNKHASDKCLITSGTLSFLVKEISNELGIDDYFGTEAEVKDGSYTGKVFGHPNFSEEKVRRIKGWIADQSFELIYAYSDSIHDLPLLEFSDCPIAVNPDDRLLEIAQSNGWNIDISRLKD